MELDPVALIVWVRLIDPITLPVSYVSQEGVHMEFFFLVTWPLLLKTSSDSDVTRIMTIH